MIQSIVEQTKEKSLTLYNKYATKSIKKTTKKLAQLSQPFYNKFYEISEFYLKSSLKVFNEYSNPILEKYSDLLNLEKSMKKLLVYKEELNFLAAFSNVRNKICEMGDTLLTRTETKVDDYYKSLKGDEYERLFDEEGFIRERIKKLAIRCNQIGLIWIHKIWKEHLEGKIDFQMAKTFLIQITESLILPEKLQILATTLLMKQSSIVDYLSQKINFKDFKGLNKGFKELFLNVKIISELAIECLTQDLINPSLKNLKITLKESKETVIITLENCRNFFKEKDFKEILTEAKEKLGGLKEVSMKMLKEKIQVYISKEKFESYTEQISEFINYLKQFDLKKLKGKEILENNKKLSLKLYNQTMENLKKQKENAKEKYQQIIKAINQRKNAEKLKREEGFESQSSTDHE